jgi:hypothetical protein
MVDDREQQNETKQISGLTNKLPNRACQSFLGPSIPKCEKYTKGPQTTPNGNTLYQMAINYTKWP